MKNLYAIKCLQSVIDTHQKKIERLSKEDGESIFFAFFYFFFNEYIEQLKKATKLLK